MSFVFGANSASTGYNLTRSLRFRASASAGLYRTLTAGNRKTFTWSGWVKRGTLGSATGQSLFDVTDNVTTSSAFYFNVFGAGTTDALGFQDQGTSTQLTTTQLFRDPSAWYHIILAVDTTQATAANRVKIYVNGSQVTSFSTATYPSLNADTTYNLAGYRNSIGMYWTTLYYFDGYLAEVNFIDGQALTPSSFGSTNALTGVWQPARYTGTYGTNGFYLPFTDNSALTTSSNVGLGKDFSGNGNYWTTNNISITAGVTYDSMTDVPTLTSATAANFAVLNPVNKATVMPAPTNGNLYITGTSGGYWNAGLQSSIGVSSGKWYWEVSAIALTISNGYFAFGIASNYFQPTTITANDISYLPGVASNTGGYWRPQLSATYFNGTGGSFSGSFAVSDVCNIAFDADTGKIWYGKNGTWLNSGNPSTGANPAFTVTTGNAPYYPWVGAYSTTDTWAINFGQQAFGYTPPTGFVALNTYNLPTSTIVKGNTVMDATLYTGTGAIQSITNAAGFKPDLLWVKARSRTSAHDLVDSVRGVNLALTSNSTQAEITGSFITSLNSNGFTLPANTLSDAYFTNVSGDTMVGWQWQAGQGSSSSNTSGSITSTVSVNANAGFSVSTFTATGATATVGHGLGVAPSFMISKSRSGTGAWVIALTYSGFTYSSDYFQFDTGAKRTDGASTVWVTAPTSSVFSIGSSFGNGVTFVNYCWTPIAGFSAFGSFVGNSTTNNAFVYTGFLPRFVLLKNSSDTSGWYIFDTARNTFNVLGELLFPNTSGAGVYSADIDILSNGFKIRTSGFSSNTWIYAAFATTPFKNSLGF